MKAKDSGLEIIKFEGDPQKFKNAKTRNINLVFHKRNRPDTDRFAGVRIEWDFWLYDSDGNEVLKYIAYDDFDAENPESMDARQAKRLLNESFTRLRLEYDHRMHGHTDTAIGYSIPEDKKEQVINTLVDIFRSRV